MIIFGAWSCVVMAIPAELPINVPGIGNTTWFLTNAAGTDTGEAFTGNCDFSAGMGILDATSANGDTNAYDNAYSVFVEGKIFVAPGTIDLEDTTLTAGPVLIDGIDVSLEYFFPGSLQAGRLRAILRNPDLVLERVVTVEMPVNLGSGVLTKIEATSSGNEVIDRDDRWVVTSNGFEDNALITPEPVVTSVLFGTGEPESRPTTVTSSVFNCFGNEGIGARFVVTIPPNTSRSLMFFTGLGDIEGLENTVDGAIQNANQFNDNDTIDEALLDGLTSTELVDTLNWDFSADTGGSSIGNTGSSSSGWGLGCSIGDSKGVMDPFLLFMAGVAGLYLLRRQRLPAKKPDA